MLIIMLPINNGHKKGLLNFQTHPVLEAGRFTINNGGNHEVTMGYDIQP